MNSVTFGMGILAVGYGVFTGVAREKKPEWFRKLGPMKEKFGDKGGWLIHFVGYTLVPIGLGVLWIVKGLAAGNR